ncbi:MAG: AAA family ATPase [Promethearchaeota archaeon]
MLRKICLIGVRGIGKTTLIKKVIKKTPWIDFLIGSRVLKQLVGNDFNNFDKFPEEKKQYFRREAIRYMENLQARNKKDILVEGHTTLYNPETNQIEKVFTDLDCEFYSDLIYYNVLPEIVLERRKNDKSKIRVLDFEIIKEELEAEYKESRRIAEKYQMGWYEINENQTQNIQDILLNLLKELHTT